MKLLKHSQCMYVNEIKFKKFCGMSGIEFVLEEIKKICTILGFNVYIVGGFVRDYLLERNSQDIDFVIEGDALIVGEELSKTLNLPFICHSDFNTGKLILHDNKTIDLVTARKEYYTSPAVLPKVYPSSIEYDLSRRDFSINSIAVKINSPQEGKVIDLFDGIRDVEMKNIRVLHDLSFVDDPTRIFRAIKYEQRLGFNIDSYTLELLSKALKKDMIDYLSGERIQNEIFSLLKEEFSYKHVQRMIELRVLERVSKTEKFDTNVTKIIKEFESDLHYQNTDRLIIKLVLLLSPFESEDIYSIIHKLSLSNKYSRSLLEMIQYKDRIFKQIEYGTLTNYEVYQLLIKLTSETVVSLYYLSPTEKVKHIIEFFLKQLKGITIETTGKNLIDLGIKPGIIFQHIFQQILEEKLNGRILSSEDEKQFLAMLLKKKGVNINLDRSR